MKRIATMVLVFALVCLPGCASKQTAYDNGYSAGYADALKDKGYSAYDVSQTRETWYEKGLNDGKSQGTMDLLNSLRKDEIISKEDWIYITGASVCLETDLDHAELFSVSSTAFSSVGYLEDYQVLWVTFKDSQQTYLYFDFPAEEYVFFVCADSLGRYFNDNIKGKYEYCKWG